MVVWLTMEAGKLYWSSSGPHCIDSSKGRLVVLVPTLPSCAPKTSHSCFPGLYHSNLLPALVKYRNAVILSLWIVLCHQIELMDGRLNKSRSVCGSEGGTDFSRRFDDYLSIRYLVIWIGTCLNSEPIVMSLSIRIITLTQNARLCGLWCS